MRSAPIARWHRQVPPRVPRPAGPAEIDVDVLELAVFVEADLAVFATDPRLLVSAERVARVDHVVVVDPHGARAQALGDANGPRGVARPYGTGKSIDRVVRQTDGLFFVVEGDNREDRPADLLMGDLHRVVDADEDRGAVVVPAVVALDGRALPADQHVGAFPAPDAHVALD